MTISEQRQFVMELIEAVRRDILDKTYDFPSDWDGMELRQYIADKFKAQCYPLKGAKLRNYTKTVITANL